ncbi:transposase [Crocosphaera chwakensis CCY0110]|uniref:Transposase n=1 Tax=Crocosphaera chwakensis CCY0110 TaxID=391612 RepID=A3IZJ0_9CHRO|nr:transposase [Crocosphaera chwakensis CCY0110]
MAIAILAVIAGAQGWEDMENYGIAKQEWLSEFLELPHGIPSDDTFRRVFERIDPKSLQKCLQKWVQSIMNSIQGEIIPIDGKTLRGLTIAIRDSLPYIRSQRGHPSRVWC